MPFRHVSHSYQPEQLKKLTAAFDLACCQITLAHNTATEIQLEQLRQRLANFIVACACRREFEPEKLLQTALRALPPDVQHDLSVGVRRATPTGTPDPIERSVSTLASAP